MARKERTLVPSLWTAAWCARVGVGGLVVGCRVQNVSQNQRGLEVRSSESARGAGARQSE
eukprot:2540708-Alexandrium_andersonii.AAC.1